MLVYDSDMCPTQIRLIFEKCLCFIVFNSMSQATASHDFSMTLKMHAIYSISNEHYYYI
jgi:hypothetical protein